MCGAINLGFAQGIGVNLEWFRKFVLTLL